MLAMVAPRYSTKEELESGLEAILAAPTDSGALTLIVRRPKVDERESISVGRLDVERGLIGDNWFDRGNEDETGAAPDLEMQLNIMGSRVAELVANGKERMPLAGDQLYLDMDLSRENLPPGTRLAIGEAIIEVTAPPHTGCKKFAERFGTEAMLFVNSGVGKKLNFRGICARVVRSGDIKLGDSATKVHS